jgi:hypothetical protein
MRNILAKTASTALALALSLQSTGVLAELDKPIMNPAVPFDQMDTNLYNHLKSTPSTYEAWEYGCTIPFLPIILSLLSNHQPPSILIPHPLVN